MLTKSATVILKTVSLGCNGYGTDTTKLVIPIALL